MTAPLPPESDHEHDEAPSAESSAGACVKPIPTHPDPTRYGDWEKSGRCIDF